MENAATPAQDSVNDVGATAAPTDAAPALAPGLYLAATPIGAANDVTLRALDVFRRADVLVAEDTRTLRRLLEIHGVALGGRPLLAYHDRNGPAARPRILRRLEAGESVVYASDAGTPLVADPGYRLAEAARAAGAAVIPLPGPSAVLTALLASGLATDAFSFCGFPPPKSGRRRAWLAAWTSAPGTLIFFEAPRRLASSLRDMLEVLGDRPAAVARELTKKFEEVRRGALADLVADYEAGEPPLGEAVVLLGPADPTRAPDESGRAAAVDQALIERLEKESLKDAVRTVTEQMDEARKYVYARAVALKEARDAAKDAERGHPSGDEGARGDADGGDSAQNDKTDARGG